MAWPSAIIVSLRRCVGRESPRQSSFIEPELERLEKFGGYLLVEALPGTLDEILLHSFGDLCQIERFGFATLLDPNHVQPATAPERYAETGAFDCGYLNPRVDRKLGNPVEVDPTPIVDLAVEHSSRYSN